MNNKFSLKRYWLYSRAELMSNRRLYLLLMGGIFAMLNIFYYLPNIGETKIKYSESSDWVVYHNASTPVINSWFFLALFVLVFTSLAFRNYFNKGYSVATMMLPASKLEKFVFAAKFHLFIVPAILLGIGSLVNWMWTASWDMPFNFFIMGAPFRIFFDVALGVLFTLSLYFIGAVLFRRLHFLFTLLSLWGISFVTGWIGYYMAKLINFELFLHRLQIWANRIVLEYGEEVVVSLFRGTLEGLGILIISGMFLIAWRRYRKLQITK